MGPCLSPEECIQCDGEIWRDNTLKRDHCKHWDESLPEMYLRREIQDNRMHHCRYVSITIQTKKSLWSFDLKRIVNYSPGFLFIIFLSTSWTLNLLPLPIWTSTSENTLVLEKILINSHSSLKTIFHLVLVCQACVGSEQDLVVLWKWTWLSCVVSTLLL